MSIYRGSQRCKIDTFLHVWRNIPKDQSTPQAIDACMEGARALDLIMQDLRAQLELYTTIDIEAAKDATDLITIASFFYFGPLTGMANAVKRKAKTQEDKKSFNTQIYELEQLYQSVIEAQWALTNLQPTPVRVAEDMKSIYSSQKRSRTEPVAITLLSPIELLMRVVTARRTWHSLENLCQEYRSLNIANSRGLKRTLAKVVFVCIGISSNGPTYIISASADHWDGYRKLSKFVAWLRRQRRNATVGDVGPGRGQEASLILDWSESLRTRWNENEPPSSLVTRPNGCFSHLHDIATPLECPSFRPKARCIRCQALFEYAVPDNVRERERTEGAFHTGFTCAETYAHFFCRELEGRGHATCVIR